MKRKLPGSTLPEMLVLLVLTGIILLAVFDGLSLFEKLRRRVITGYGWSIAAVTGYYRIEELFSRADSVVGIRDTMSFYRRGAKLSEMVVADSVLTVSADTLLSGIFSHEILSNGYSPALADSLFITLGEVELKFGVGYNPCLITEWAMLCE